MYLIYLYLYSIIYLLNLLDYSLSAPDSHCFHRFNGSDCGRTPTPVFHYYHPGSRCEIGIWRGCFTPNIFESEDLCSHHCIYRFLGVPADGSPSYLSRDTCQATLNSTKCSDHSIKVYTYDRAGDICLPAVWRGCNTGNLFTNEHNCKLACKRNDSSTNFAEQVLELMLKDAQNIDSILDSVVPQTTTSTQMYTIKSTSTTKMPSTAHETEAVPDATYPITTTTTTTPVATTVTTTIETTVATTETTKAPTMITELPTTRVSGTVEEVVLP
ncbi:unnamed protein product, partial [Iphiclides podalirius]